jgi:hypothetical protein
LEGEITMTKFKIGDKIKIARYMLDENKLVTKEMLLSDKYNSIPDYLRSAIISELECEVTSLSTDDKYPYRVTIGERTDLFKEEELEYYKIQSWKDVICK